MALSHLFNGRRQVAVSHLVFIIRFIRKGRVSLILGNPEGGYKGRYKGLFYGPEAL